jgi:unsaturated rhamnogalacturonyl hydrolase
MLKVLGTLLLGSLMAGCAASTTVDRGSAPWSVRIADSFIRLHPDSIVYQDEAKSRRWNYEQGLMLEAFYQTWRHTGDTTYLLYTRRNLDHYVMPDGSISTYELDEFNIDNVTPGKAAVRMFELTGEQRYRVAADSIRKQLSLHPRTKSGGFWHKQIYPYQMWLDGLYMGSPFYARYAAAFGEARAFDDIVHQFRLIEQNLRDPKTGLYYHGWDESKAMGWADPVTGRSPNFWGRAMGWFSMAIVDVLDDLPADHPGRQELIRILRDLAPAILAVRDRESALWFQVMDRGGEPGNYWEASASAMFAYAFLKGANRQYLPPEYATYGRESFEGLLRHLVTVEPDGTIRLREVVKVSGLGGKPYRDGSYAYYISEPRRTNDFKGYGPFLLAAIELERGKRP